MNKNIQRLAEPNVRMYMIVLILFAVATLAFGKYELAAAEAVVILLLLIFSIFQRRRREKQLTEYIESVAYDTETAKNNTLSNFPLPIAVFRLQDTGIIWGNEMFFQMCGAEGTRLDAHISDLVPQFSGKWLLEGKNRYPSILSVGERKYQLHGNIVRSQKADDDSAFMGITYWVDVTEYDDIRIEYESSRPVAAYIIIDNLEELIRNQPERIKNDIREAVDDLLTHWSESCKGILKRYERDKYLFIFESRYLEQIKADKFRVIEDVHRIVNPAGINATISIGMGIEADSMSEALQFANISTELALSRGGDQAVLKNKLSFDFYGGRGLEVEKRTKVRSRVMANTFAELIRDSSRVLIMGHRFADLDSVGASVGVAALARKFGVSANIVVDADKNVSKPLIAKLCRENEYKDAFISVQDAMLLADGKTLLVLVDTNRPEQAEDSDLLLACNRVAVIDHHRVAATYVHNAAMSFIEPYASSACELITELWQEKLEAADILKCEAEAMMTGIVLDTKNFTLRTGERTFEAAAYLRRAGADTSEVKKLLQNDIDDTVARYGILQCAKLYRGVAVAAPVGVQNRVVAAQAADELLNISGVETSFVIFQNDNGGVSVSARSIGELNVQVIMEKLGGGGNRSAAAVQFSDVDRKTACERVKQAIDEYMDG